MATYQNLPPELLCKILKNVTDLKTMHALLRVDRRSHMIVLKESFSNISRLTVVTNSDLSQRKNKAFFEVNSIQVNTMQKVLAVHKFITRLSKIEKLDVTIYSNDFTSLTNDLLHVISQNLHYHEWPVKTLEYTDTWMAPGPANHKYIITFCSFKSGTLVSEYYSPTILWE